MDRRRGFQPRRGFWKRAPAIPAGHIRVATHHVGTMSANPSDYEKLGQFYLGRSYNPDTKQADGDLLLYDSKDLVTHGVVLGMTGSGKTGLCLALLEEAAMDNIPAIVIDPKGDISNLLLTFPDLDGKSFRPWINEDDAAKKGISPDEHAEKTAAMWKQGLADWGQSPERIRDFRNKTDIHIFTPGSKAGIPVSILSSLEVPPFEIMDDGELLGERIESTVSSLLSLVGVDAGSLQSPEAVLISNIFRCEWEAGRNITLETLIRLIQSPPFEKVGIIDLESFLPEKSRQPLALKFNNLLASPGFSTWLEGPPLDIAKMLHDPSGKPRISIFSIAHLDDTQRMFFVSLLLNQMLGWMRAQKGTTSLRALLYMDEIFGFLPPTANPPSKRPMMTILKQGRAFGLGCLLATQNPVDLDYKALSNIGTWFLGRLQTERDKLRVLDGLEGAAGSQNAPFNRQEMETLLSGLGNRVFLMNNVHEDHPALFHVRWVMSYLTGPLTRGQIKTLMDPKRAAFETGAKPAASNPMAMPGGSSAAAGTRPAVGAGVTELFAPAGGGGGVIYQPYLLRVGKVRYSNAKSGVDESREVRLVNPVLAGGIDWETQFDPPQSTSDKPAADAGFTELPGFAMNAANYKQVEKQFADWLYENNRLEILSCPALKTWSKPGETEGEFRARLTHAAHEARDAEVEKLRAATTKKTATIESRMQTAEARLAKEKAEAGAAKMQAGVSVLGGLLGGLLGRKVNMTTLSRGSAAIGRTTSAYKQHQDVAMAGARIEDLAKEMASLNAELEAEVARIAEQYDTAGLRLETETLKPTKTNVKVETVALLWMAADII
jgi:Helicase HerA, central domain